MLRSPDQQLSALSSLLEGCEAVESLASARQRASLNHENHLVQVRLGMASSLLLSLRAKHPPSASHSLRVAVGCSAWAAAMRMPDQQRDELEVAALLHDVGKIGVPDSILRKPGALSPEEIAIVESHRRTGMEILASCCASMAIKNIVHYSPAWYNGRNGNYDRLGEDLPLGSRMVAIVDAFDAMTTEHVYRAAMSRERTINELFEFAGAQFDPRLVQQYCELVAGNEATMLQGVMRHWLKDLQATETDEQRFWALGSTCQPAPLGQESLFHQRLLDNMHDAVVFIDAGNQVVHWNRSAERLTGIPASAALHKQWAPSLIDMRDERGAPVPEADDPVQYTMRTGVQLLRRLSVTGRANRPISVDAQAVPVVGADGIRHGAALLLHDASSQINLEERVQTLAEKATRDPLTKVGNRAEFDRSLERFIESHLDRGAPCSLIISDIDHFKKINDNFGHQAGDEALIIFASLLSRHSRDGDVAARYGGEEFVLLCADCDNVSATRRAEQIRRELAEMPQPSLGGKNITSSFGVTEIQLGDTPETMLRRADRALLEAKARGRNTVVQLGGGLSGERVVKPLPWWLAWMKPAPPDMLIERHLGTPMPLKVIAEKLRGFVADQQAEIVSIDEDHIILKLEGQSALRRRSDRPVPFLVELKFTERRLKPDESPGTKGDTVRTMIHVVIRPKRNRDRRRRDAIERARQLFVSLKSYLMANEQAGARG